MTSLPFAFHRPEPRAVDVAAPGGERMLFSRWIMILPPVLAVLAVAGLPLDLPVARWFLGEHCPNLVRQLFEEAEPFGNAVGVLIICFVLWRVDRRLHVLDIALVLCASLGAGLAANGVKLLVVRVRPRSFSYEGGVWDTFVQFMPHGRLNSDVQSFPSAHVATALGLALALTLLYPRIREVFFVLTVFVGLQRLEIGAHYVSDVLAGAAIGAVVGIVAVRWHVYAGRTPLAKAKKVELRGAPTACPRHAPHVDLVQPAAAGASGVR